MIVQCPACRALVVVERLLRADDDEARAGLRCSACGEVSWLPLVHAQEAPDEVEPEQAPEEAAPLPPVAAQNERAQQPAGTKGTGMSAHDIDRVIEEIAQLAEVAEEEEDLAEAFIELLDQWDDEAQHKKLIKRAALEDRLAFVGLRYRAVLTVRPDDPVATRAQEEILVSAMSTLRMATPTKETRAMGRSQTLLILLTLIVIGLSVWVSAQALEKMP